MQAAVLEFDDVDKIFRSPKREAGLRGFVRAFTGRELVQKIALERVRLVLAPGEFVGLIGPNGAGKTTLVKVAVGIVPATSGVVRAFGRDAFRLRDEDKARLSLVMGQRSQLWWDIPPLDSFQLLREIYRVEATRFAVRVREYSERLGVAAELHTQLRHLSLGARMKMEIIGAFLHDPDLVFLDEPTIGLDLPSRETIRAFLVELNRERGATVVLTSHDLEDIEETCRRLVILHTGRIVYDGDLVGLRRAIVDKRSIEVHLEPHAPRPDLARLELERFRAHLAGEAPFALTFSVPAAEAHALVRKLLDVLPVRDLSVEREPLEALIKEIYARPAIAAERTA